MQIVTDMANTADIPEILELLRQVQKVHSDARPDIFVAGKSKYNAEQVKEILTNPLLPVIVARADGKTVGYAMCKLQSPEAFSPQKPHSLYIDDLCVDENMRGKGIGTLLYLAAKDYACAHDCYNITLNVWQLNSGAVAFYQKMGLVPLRTTLECIL